MSCENKTLHFKTGSQVKMNCRYKDSQGVAKSLVDVVINADFIDNKTGNLLISTGSDEVGGIVITDGINGEYTIDAGIATDWPIGLMPVDILYTDLNGPSHTEDFFIDFSAGRTKAT